MIEQAYISKSVDDFPWLERLDLKPYHDPNSPAVFFGMYRPEDFEALRNHKWTATVRWCGMDALNYETDIVMYSPNVGHVSPLPKVRELLRQKNIECMASRMEDIFLPTEATPNGEMIYSYVHHGAAKYYGSETLKIIQQLGYKLVIGDGKIPMARWEQECGGYYDRCYMGLMLSDFAGGAFSVIEMGLRGKYCITNVVDSPNALKWNTISDICAHLESGKVLIGKKDDELADSVRKYLSKIPW